MSCLVTCGKHKDEQSSFDNSASKSSICIHLLLLWSSTSRNTYAIVMNDLLASYMSVFIVVADRRNLPEGSRVH